LRESHQAAGRPRIPGSEDEIALFDRFGGPAEKVSGRKGLIVLVNPEEGDVEVVPGIGEIIGIAAEKGHCVFWGKN